MAKNRYVSQNAVTGELPYNHDRWWTKSHISSQILRLCLCRGFMSRQVENESEMKTLRNMKKFFTIIIISIYIFRLQGHDIYLLQGHNNKYYGKSRGNKKSFLLDIMNNEETCLQYIQVILKHPLQYYLKI